MTPIGLMIVGGFTFLLCVVLDVINLLGAARGNSNFGVIGFFHVLFGILAAIGGVTFIIGAAMFLIDYAKHA